MYLCEVYNLLTLTNMKRALFILVLITLFTFTANAQTDSNSRYIEVSGSSEMEFTPDQIHYIIEVKEYFLEEYEKKSKPENYRTKVSIKQIEKELRSSLYHANINDESISVQEIGEYWREKGQDFLIGKKFDIVLSDFNQIDQIIGRVDTKSINRMYIGNMTNRKIQEYRRKVKIDALKAAREKAEYLVESLGKTLGDVIMIVEPQDNGYDLVSNAQSNITYLDAVASENFRNIKLQYSMRVRFEIK